MSIKPTEPIIGLSHALDPRHFYNYRAAYDAGDEPTLGEDGYHWPSKYKREGHPNMVVDGVNTKTGAPSFGGGSSSGAGEGSDWGLTDVDIEEMIRNKPTLEADYQYDWLLDGIRMDALADLAVVPSDQIYAGEVWSVEVTPVVGDGQLGPPSKASVTINTPPSAAVALVDATGAPHDGDSSKDVMVELSLADIDAHDAAADNTEYDLEWTLDGVLIDPTDPLVISTTALVAGQVWTVSVSPYTYISERNDPPQQTGETVTASLSIVDVGGAE